MATPSTADFAGRSGAGSSRRQSQADTHFGQSDWVVDSRIAIGLDSLSLAPACLTSTFDDLEGLAKDISKGLFLDDATADVRLRVQDSETFPAHRAILGARSPVFRAMLFGGMRERYASNVEVNAFAPKTVRQLLRYMYAGRLESVNFEDMVPLMACADHYGVTNLRDNISGYLADSISAETACMVLSLAREHRQEHIVDQYLEFICVHAQEVAKTEGFIELDRSLLLKILEADDARIEEIDLFKALVRWYRRAVADGAHPVDLKADELFGFVRYGQMTGQQLVTEVRPLAGDIVPSDLYVRALEQVAAPDVAVASSDEAQGVQCRRRKPPLGGIQVSDPHLLHVQSMAVLKVGPPGWNCTAVIDPSTPTTRFVVEHLTDVQNGIGIAIFNPEKSSHRASNNQQTYQSTAISSGFPNPNQWGADCMVGIYGTGCLFGIITDHVMRWRAGLVIEVTMRVAQGGNWHVTFVAEGEGGERLSAEGVLSCQAPGSEATQCSQVPPGVKLALALYSTNDKVVIEPA